MHRVSSPSLTSRRDVLAAEAWSPSSELGQTAPRMFVPVAPPRGLSLRDPSACCGGRCLCSQGGGLPTTYPVPNADLGDGEESSTLA